MDLWWRMRRLFVKEAFSWPLLLDGRKPIGTMEGLPINFCGREEMIRMKDRGVSLGIGVTQGDRPIAASSVRLVNLH